MEDPNEPVPEQSLAALTTEIVSAYVSNNTISTNEVGQLIVDVSQHLRRLGRRDGQEAATPEPAVSVRRSIGSEHLICLVCGKKQRLLKRHLANDHELTPKAYRQLFNLKPDYPMVAPGYAAMRRELALKIGLGRPKQPEPKKKSARKKAPTPVRSQAAAS